MYELLIQNGGTIYLPAVEDGVTWDTERKGSPGRLSFSVVKDAGLNFQEGSPVSFRQDGKDVFYGFVFTKRRDKSGLIQVTAYDQLRYLKNKDTVREVGVTASGLLKMLAADFRLQCGEIEDTGYTIESIAEDDQSLFDIILGALDETTQATGKLFVLYDDFGKLCLRNIGNMKREFLVDRDVSEDLDYSSSIDGQTYNKVKLAYENSGTGKRDVFIAQDGDAINRWGVLQYYGGVQTETGAAQDGASSVREKEKRLTAKSVLSVGREDNTKAAAARANGPAGARRTGANRAGCRGARAAAAGFTSSVTATSASAHMPRARNCRAVSRAPANEKSNCPVVTHGPDKCKNAESVSPVELCTDPANAVGEESSSPSSIIVSINLQVLSSEPAPTATLSPVFLGAFTSSPAADIARNEQSSAFLAMPSIRRRRRASAKGRKSSGSASPVRAEKPLI